MHESSTVPQLKTYRVKFRGRLRLAIGIKYPCSVTVRAENEDAALLKLYETHEHISHARFTEVKT